MARAEGERYALRVPLTTAPRYTRSDEVGGRHAQAQPLAVFRDPDHRFALDVTLRGADHITSPTHTLKLDPVQSGQRVQLAEGEVVPDRDCVLSWQPRTEMGRPTLDIWLHCEDVSRQVYFLAQVAPPMQTGEGMARELVVLLDRSGSMGGPKWAAAVWAVRGLLASLTERDRFNLALFDDRQEWLATEPGVASADVLKSAAHTLDAAEPRGGTELGVVLEQALAQAKVEGEFARHLLIVTDAQVTDAGRILRLVDEAARAPRPWRISVLCIDAAPNAFLAQEIADRSGGAARFLTSDPGADDITTALDGVLADWSALALADLRLEVNQAGIEGARGIGLPGMTRGWSALDLGDLPADRGTWAMGRVALPADGELIFRLAQPAERPLAEVRVKARDTDQRPALKALFGARRVNGIEYLMHAGYSGQDLKDGLERLGYRADKALAQGADGPPRVYAENTRQDAETALRGLLVREALEYGLASAETAFVAVRQEAGQPVEGTVAVGNALPQGWSENFLTGAQAPRMMMLSASAPKKYSRGGGMSLQGLTGQAADAMIGRVRADTGPSLTDIKPVVIFSSSLATAGGRAVLYSSDEPGAAKLPEGITFSRLSVQYPNGAPDAASLRGLTLRLYVGDLSTPRAVVKLDDLARLGGERPLNVARRLGDVVLVVLEDTQGVWVSGAPRLQVSLR